MFDHILTNAEDAHHTLIDKVQRKRGLKLSDMSCDGGTPAVGDRVFVKAKECDNIS